MPKIPFTSENASEMAYRSHAAREQATRERKELVERAKDAIALAESIPEYVVTRLARVRVQLDRIDDMLMKERDPSKLDRLASAQSRLAQQERELAGRPLPGSLRPTGKPTRSRPDSLPQAGFSNDGGNGG